MALRDRFHIFTFSKGFILVLSLIVGLGSGSIGALVWETIESSLICGLIGFAATWLAYYGFIFLLLSDSTAKGEEL